MEDALSRLDRAIDYALLATVGGSAQQRGALYRRLAAALSTQGAVNAEDDIALLPNFPALEAVLPVLVRDEDGRRSLHPVWGSPDFIAPAVAALAVLFDRSLDPGGTSRLRPRLSPRSGALYGYRLDGLDAAPGGGDEAGPLSDADRMHLSVILSGAALAFLKETAAMRFAPCYLHALVQARESAAPSPDEGRAAPRSVLE
jgi:hypothetical protein